MLSIWDKGQTGGGASSAGCSVLGWERRGVSNRPVAGDDAARATQRQKNKRLDKDKNRRLGFGRVPIKGQAFFPPLLSLFFFSLDMKSDLVYL